MTSRPLRELGQGEFDVVIVGGGIFGICLAWEAASRGLSVALAERGDFSGATSANSFKMVHGGIRYLQHADLPRIRESCEERRSLLRAAPHLVRPLPILIPTYGHGTRGKAFLRAGLMLYELLTLDKNRGLRDPARRIPPPRIVSRGECLGLFPALESPGLTGGAVFHDGQMYNPTRLALSFLRSAIEAGARAANYLEVTGFVVHQGRVLGVKARDVFTGADLEIRARLVINAAGPWAEALLEQLPIALPRRRSVFSRDACFVVTRRLTPDCALAVPGATSDPDALLSRGKRHLFLVPWRRYTLVGVWHVVHQGPPGRFTVSPDEIRSFIREINAACPALGLKPEDVSRWNAGLVLFGQNEPAARDLRYAHRSTVIDHEADHGIAGLLTVIGVRYTTARGVACRVIDRVFTKMGRRPPPSRTDSTPVFGGDFDSFDRLELEARGGEASRMSEDVRTALLRNYGARYRDVLRYLKDEPALGEPIGSFTTLRAEVPHAIHHEMAVTLGDVVFRRTDLATGEYPGDENVSACARLMARELGWDEARIEREIRSVRETFPDLARTIQTESG